MKPSPKLLAHESGKFIKMSNAGFATIGSSMFKDTTGRDDFQSYIPKASNNTNNLKNLGPGSYFKEKSPFLKRSYNASLPQPKFY